MNEVKVKERIYSAAEVEQNYKPLEKELASTDEEANEVGVRNKQSLRALACPDQSHKNIHFGLY